MMRISRLGWSRASARPGFVTVMVGVLGLVGWLTWPSDGQLDVLRCVPDGALARFSATLYGRGFWRSQLGPVEAERRLAERWDRLQAEIDTRMERILSRSDDKLNSLYASHPELAPTPAELETSRAQEADEANEALLRRQQLSEFVAARARSLATCEREIQARMER
jgi:hypothetical protein